MAGPGADLLRLQQRANCRRTGGGSDHHQDAYPQSVSETRRGPSPGCGTTRPAIAEDDGVRSVSLAG